MRPGTRKPRAKSPGPGKSVLLLGSTGLVGGSCLEQLLGDEGISRVVTLTRRPLEGAIPSGKHENHVVDFARLQEKALLFDVEAVVCALGTTIKDAGSQRRFRDVDFEYPLAAAKIAKGKGVPHFLLVSALGADARSRVFYNRVKGEIEEAVGQLGFPSFTIVRPSLLLGQRRDFRLGEEIGKMLAFLTPRRFKPVEARAVAACLVQAVLEGRLGQRVIASEEIASAVPVK